MRNLGAEAYLVYDYRAPNETPASISKVWGSGYEWNVKLCLLSMIKWLLPPAIKEPFPLSQFSCIFTHDYSTE